MRASYRPRGVVFFDLSGLHSVQDVKAQHEEDEEDHSAIYTQLHGTFVPQKCAKLLGNQGRNLENKV